MANGKTICTVCNYIFDEALGEPRQEIQAGRKFEELSEEWACPECGSSKEMFQPCSCVSLPIYEHTCVSKLARTGSRKDLLAELSVGQIIADHPGRACVLEQYGIDYCCGGKKSLQDACSEKGIRIEEILVKFDEADRKEKTTSEPDWTKTSLKTLIDHIVTHYHQALRAELPRITERAEKVARVHGANHPEMVKVLQVLKSFKEQLELHMQKEELILFPGIVGIEAGKSPKSFGCGGGVEHPIEVMTQEHEDAGDALAELNRLTNQYTPPADACDTFKVLLHSLASLELEMHQHVHKENNILFPRAAALAKAATACK